MKRNRLIKRKKINFFPSNVIKNNKGNLIKILRKRSIHHKKFEECYISEIKPNKIKAWRYHKNLNQNIFLLDGKCKVVILLNKKFKKFLLSEKKPGILNIPNKHWYGFKNLSKKRKVRILNIIDKKYQEKEILRKALVSFDYNWK
tara:strand:+ start:706 stop:1140 length:435 start_codon:yes stop_codon:yes gene_type:complete